jgi:hypothetical protein
VRVRTSSRRDSDRVSLRSSASSASYLAIALFSKCPPKA